MKELINKLIKKDWLPFLGKSFFIIACLLFILITIYYFSNRWYVSFQDYGSLLAGFAGFFITASGVIYLVQTIKVTQKEMERTSELMSNQLAESTFFNLLKSHKETYQEESKNIVHFKNLVNETFNVYFFKFVVSASGSIEELLCNPISQYKHLEQLHGICQSLLHITNLIEEQFEQKQRAFYHKTFYNNINDSERFFLGMIIKFKIEPDVKERYSYNYLNEFNEKAEYFQSNDSILIPPFTLLKLRNGIVLSSFERSKRNYKAFSDYGKIRIAELSNLIKVTRFNYTYEEIGYSYDKAYIPDDNDFNYSFILDNNDLIQKLKKGEKVQVRWQMVFVYESREYVLYLPNFIVEADSISRQELIKRQINLIDYDSSQINFVGILIYFPDPDKKKEQ